MTRAHPKTGERLRASCAELSGALGDLGVFLPYVVAITGGGLFAPMPVFAAFAAGYVLVALVYGCAVPAMMVLGLSLVWGRGPWALIVIGGAVALAPAGDPVGVAIAAPAAELSVQAVLSGIVAQLPLTLLNAIVVAAAVARSLYPAQAARLSERKLAATSGALNLLFVPLGALPMCHGAGGIAAHHRFGARGIGAPLIMAALCGAGALAGPAAIGWLALIPIPVVGALLVYASADLILSRRMFDARPDCRPVIGVAAAATLGFGAGAGLIAGLGAEAVRVQIRRRRGRRAPDTRG